MVHSDRLISIHSSREVLERNLDESPFRTWVTTDDGGYVSDLIYCHGIGQIKCIVSYNICYWPVSTWVSFYMEVDQKLHSCIYSLNKTTTSEIKAT